MAIVATTALYAASTAIAAIGGGVSMFNTRKAAKANAKLEKKELAESIRKTEIAQGQIEGNLANQVGASGFAAGSSLDRYITTVQEQHASDIDWMRTSSASRAAIAQQEATAMATAQFISTAGAVAGGVGKTKASAEQYGWRTK